MKATFHGHACFVVERDGKRVIIDPVLTGNPAADIGPDKLPQFCGDQGAASHGMHIGGAHVFPFGTVKLVPAFHGGRVEGDETGKSPPIPAASS